MPECDICFVYTVTEALVGPMLDDKFPRAASAMEAVADYYGIPTIHMGMKVAKLAKEGKLLWKSPLPKTDAEKKEVEGKFVFAPDSVHPHVETGHVLYAKAVKDSMAMIAEKTKAKKAPHELKSPLNAKNYEQAKLVPIAEATLSNGFAALDSSKDDIGKRFANRMKPLFKGAAAGETISFKFKGTRAAIYDILGPDCGQVTVTLDEKPARVVPRFDSYCTYHRLSTLLIGSDLPDAVHTVRIEIHPEQPDKAKILAQRNGKMDKPERFNGTSFYPAAILVVGELVK